MRTTDAMTSALAQNRFARRSYWQAYNDAHRDALRARRAAKDGEPILARYFAALATQGFGYATAMRSGDWSKTRIRPLEWFAEQARKAA